MELAWTLGCAGSKDQLQIVDVRYPNEWEAGHIDGAIHLPEDYLTERLGELDQARQVITVCPSGRRSQEAVTLLREHGFLAENLDGGLLGWEAEGFPLQTVSGEAGTLVEPEPPIDDRPEEMQHLQASFLDIISRCRSTSVTASRQRTSWRSSSVTA